MRLEINGQAREVRDGLLLPELVQELGLVAETLLLEVNGRALLRSEWAGWEIKDGDKVEILRVVAGG